MKGQPGTTVAVYVVLAVLVAVAVAGVTMSGNRQPLPPLEVVIDMPPPATKPAVDHALGPAPEPEDHVPNAPDRRLAEVPETDVELASKDDLPSAAEGGGLHGLSDPPATDVQEIETAAGSESIDDMPPPPGPIEESVNGRKEDAEAAGAIQAGAASNEPVAANETMDAEFETTEPPPSEDLANGSPATELEPAIEGRQLPVESTLDAPDPFFEVVVISRRSNLRSQPEVDSPVLAKLNPGDQVFRMDDTPVEGYYRVSSQGIVGWIWWLNVSDGPGGNVDG